MPLSHAYIRRAHHLRLHIKLLCSNLPLLLLCSFYTTKLCSVPSKNQERAMVVLAKGELEQITLPPVQKPALPFVAVPAVDLAGAAAGRPGRAAEARELVAACEEHGFFKVTNHGVPAALLARMEAAAAAFFGLPQDEKELLSAAAAASPFGYANKCIGCNGDLGWIEYLLLEVTAKGAMPMPFSALPLPLGEEATSSSSSSSSSFRDLVNEYIVAVRRMACEVLELMAEGLDIGQKDVFTRLVLDEESDSMLRVNHYPPRPERLQQQLGRGGLTGFGEHTDPQIISVLRSNDTSGLEISLRDGSWVSVPPDQGSFFVNVGDSLQVLTNGRFRSVRHRVMVNSVRSRMSMIFFGAPPLREKIAPLPCLMGGGGRSLYREFTWKEYKSSAYRTKLADNRLCQFEN